MVDRRRSELHPKLLPHDRAHFTCQTNSRVQRKAELIDCAWRRYGSRSGFTPAAEVDTIAGNPGRSYAECSILLLCIPIKRMCSLDSAGCTWCRCQPITILFSWISPILHEPSILAEREIIASIFHIDQAGSRHLYQLEICKEDIHDGFRMLLKLLCNTTAHAFTAWNLVQPGQYIEKQINKQPQLS